MAPTINQISHLAFLQCSECDRSYSAEALNTYASCERCQRSPLISQYESLSTLRKEDINTQERSMWRYFPMLPVQDKQNIVTLGEGWTPLLSLKRLAERLEVENLLIKDESQNPTCSFKARGLSMAISKAKELGVDHCIVPTAGNAGSAMAAYCARAGMKATVVMPSHTPEAFKIECDYFGAQLILVDGLIGDCAKKVEELKRSGEYFDVSTMKEPYRIEGKKTMGYEIAEQLNWTLPDVILYPTGGGTGLIGLWKAFHEMTELGWINNNMPRLIAVQSENCKPVVETFLTGAATLPCTPSMANGLAVASPFAQRLIQKVLVETSGCAIAVSENEILQSIREIASVEGMFVAPEGAALLPALRKLLQSGHIKHSEKILLLNTGSGYKYIDNLN
jgi:threonine synthase